MGLMLGCSGLPELVLFTWSESRSSPTKCIYSILHWQSTWLEVNVPHKVNDSGAFKHPDLLLSRSKGMSRDKFSGKAGGCLINVPRHCNNSFPLIFALAPLWLCGAWDSQCPSHAGRLKQNNWQRGSSGRCDERLPSIFDCRKHGRFRLIYDLF